MNALKSAVLILVAVAIVGCGSSRPQSEIDRGRQAVTAVLENWKINEPPAKLKSLPDPVDFTEELRSTHKLVDYSIVKADGTDPQVIRYTVTLKLQDKKGKPVDREVVYSVALKSPVVVARDPYF